MGYPITLSNHMRMQWACSGSLLTLPIETDIRKTMGAFQNDSVEQALCFQHDIETQTEPN